MRIRMERRRGWRIWVEVLGLGLGIWVVRTGRALQGVRLDRASWE